MNEKLNFSVILFLFPFYAQAGFPDGENGYDLKKIEESFRKIIDINCSNFIKIFHRFLHRFFHRAAKKIL